MKKCPYCGELLTIGSIQCKSCKKYLDGKTRVEERCECGNLIAKLTENTIEVKCRRCKRIHIIQVDLVKELYQQLLKKQQGTNEPDKEDK